jgi:hypothetical protein
VFPNAFIGDLFAADQLGSSASVWWSCCNITESAIRRQSSHERFVVGDGRFRIPNTFNISIAAPMPELKWTPFVRQPEPRLKV